MNARHAMGTKAPYHLQEMQALSRRGMTELVLFLLISTAFFFCRQTDLLAPLAESARQILGCPPPAALITMAVAGYVASASVLLLNRILTGARPLFKWSNLFFRTIFFLFYAFAAALESHFIGVFVAGLVLFALEQLNIWTYCVKTQPTGKALPSKS